MKRSLWVFVCVLTLLAAGYGHSLQARPSITGARAGQHGNATRFVLDLSENTSFRIYTLADPYRLVLDLAGAAWALDDNSLTLNQGLVGSVRYGRIRMESARIVVDLKAPVMVKQAFMLAPRETDDFRLVIDLDKVEKKSFRPAALNSPASARPAAAWRESSPRRAENDSAETQGIVASVLAAKIPKPAPPRPGVASKGALDRLIVIDPGHGGADPGALAGGGIFEKNITLAAAKALRPMLKKMGYRVILSRRDDRYLSLAERAQGAQDRDADLFISLHTDEHENSKIRGASVYTLSEKASDAETEALARRENEVDSLFNVDFSHEYSEDVLKILISLVQRKTKNCSVIFAGELIPQLAKSTKLLGRTHRFAGFRVLKAPKVASVLVEMGYLSNNKDRKMLVSKKGRKALMRRVADAIDSYFSIHETC